ncbi:MAG: hypothetical protein IPH60_00225 [Flavobacteriales bacterium]|nr:hypothetical protein [Flavobacteriales bacterium]
MGSDPRCERGPRPVFVVYEGITCLDLGTGKVLWSTTFDNTETSLGLKAKQVIGRAAMPLPAADGVYVCDFSKGRARHQEAGPQHRHRDPDRRQIGKRRHRIGPYSKVET